MWLSLALVRAGSGVAAPSSAGAPATSRAACPGCPRYSLGAFGLGSKVSNWLGPPHIQKRMTEVGGGLVALRVATGEKLWTTPAPKPACLGVAGCSAAQPAPVTVIPGVAFLGSWDGHIRAYETKAGAIIWDFDTAQDFQTVNNVPAHGGSINSMPPVIAGGMLYITSGYGGGGMPGNVLLAFSVDGK